MAPGDEHDRAGGPGEGGHQEDGPTLHGRTGYESEEERSGQTKPRPAQPAVVPPHPPVGLNCQERREEGGGEDEEGNYCQKS